jgi:hypothetical protein
MSESFSRSWRGTVSSSAGYTVRVAGRTAIRYADASGELLVDCEVQAGPHDCLVVIAPHAPEAWAELTRRELLSRVKRALEFDGWEVLFDPAGYLD